MFFFSFQNDIKEADVTIKESYKIYWKLKTRALEETLTDITFCDDVQDNVSNESPQKSTSNEKLVPNPSPVKMTKDAENIYPHNSQLTTDIESSVDKSGSANVKGAWGDHLSKNNEQAPKKKQSLLIGRSSSFQLSRNKFESSTFTKRNPRKSLSSNKIRIKSEKQTASSNSNDVDCKETSDGRNSLVMVDKEETKPVFGESVKVTFEGSKPVLHSINAVQQLVDGRVTGVNRNLNQGWLDRCTRDSNLEMSVFTSQRLSNTSDSGVESMESSIHSPKDLTPAAVVNSVPSSRVSDEEDFISNSDSEEERRNKRIANYKKRLSDQEGRPVKRRCVEVDPNVAKSIDACKLPSNVEASFNLAHGVVTKTDDINAFKLTPDIDASFNLFDESARSLKVARDPYVKSNVTVKAATEHIYQLEIDQAKCGPKTVNASSELTDSVNRGDSSIPAEKSTKQYASYQRVKQVVSDDSDPDYVEGSKSGRKTKTKVKKSSTRSARKSTGQLSKRKPTSNRGKSNVRSTRAQSTLKEDDEERVSDSENGKIPIYGVETIEAVPRFAMRSTGTGDLITQFSESVSSVESKKDVPLKTNTKLTDKEKLEKKMAAGTMNDNFVRINLKKKVFVRGKKNFNFSKYKKNQWKQRKKDLASSESNLDAADLIDKNGMTCFKCGESGHFARNCTVSKGDALLPLQEIDESSSFPTLEEAEKMASQKAVVAHSRRIDRLPARPSFSTTKVSDLQSVEEEGKKEEEEEEVVKGGKEETEELATKLFDDDFADPVEQDAPTLGHKIPQELLSRLLPPQMEVVNPLYPVNEDGGLVETPAEVFEALRMFGHDSFRAGQEKAVMRVLSGRSTLVTLSTGSGKSLCYQLPAYLYSQHSRCITLVVSPLVSLMDDQVTGVPLFLSAASLHTSQSPKVREQVMQAVKDGHVNILLVSPEAVVAGEKSTGFGALLRQLPPIAFACIDEAHCISQWSHNFRPSYLMLCRVLKEKLGVKTVLGLTATATRATAESIVNHLDLPDGMAGVISDVPMPRNLVLTVSKDGNKDHALIALLRSERFQGCDSVIVYCTRREECTRIAGLLRVSLQVTIATCQVKYVE